MINYEEYKLRVIYATPMELTLITFELLIKNIDSSIENFDNDEIFKYHIKESKKFLKELILALNMQEKIAHNLFDLYNFVNKILINQMFKKNKEDLVASLEIITNIKDGFDQIKMIDTATPLMENTDSIYAGLTYKNGKLSEYVNPSNKGFKA